jgi:hypothetical protein
LPEDEQTSKHGGGGRYNAIWSSRGAHKKCWKKKKEEKNEYKEKKKEIKNKIRMTKEKNIYEYKNKIK